MLSFISATIFKMRSKLTKIKHADVIIRSTISTNIVIINNIKTSSHPPQPSSSSPSPPCHVVIIAYFRSKWRHHLSIWPGRGSLIGAQGAASKEELRACLWTWCLIKQTPLTQLETVTGVPLHSTFQVFPSPPNYCCNCWSCCLLVLHSPDGRLYCLLFYSVHPSIQKLLLLLLILLLNFAKGRFKFIVYD